MTGVKTLSSWVSACSFMGALEESRTLRRTNQVNQAFLSHSVTQPWSLGADYVSCPAAVFLVKLVFSLELKAGHHDRKLLGGLKKY